MMTTQFIEDNFKLLRMPAVDHGWLLQPKHNGLAPDYRYVLTFLPHERRFVLSRQLVTPFTSVVDDALIASIKALLPPEEVAQCMRLAITKAADPDDIPF